MPEDDLVRLDTRLAGQLRRYHTWPITGQQTVAEHTWQMLRIYMSVADKYELHIIYYIIFHDIGEHYTGDIPYPIKSNNPGLKEIMDLLEADSYKAQSDYWRLIPMDKLELTDEDKCFVKQIEMMEMAEFGLEQMCLGNQYGAIIADRCLRAVYKTRPRACSQLIQYAIKRLRLFYQQHTNMLGLPLNEWWLIDQWRKLDESK